MIIMATDDLSRYSLQTDDGAPTNVDINAGYWDAMIRGLRDRLHSANQSWEACGRERDQLRKERDEANEESDGLRNEVDFLKTMLTGADAKVKRLEGECATPPVAPVPASDPILALTSRLDNLQGEINGVVDAAGMRLEGHEERLDRLEEQIAEFAVGGCRPAREAGRRIAAAEERVKFCLEAFESVAAKMDHPKIVALLRPGTGEPAHWASNTREEKS